MAEKTVKDHVTSDLLELGMQRHTQAAVLGSRTVRRTGGQQHR